MSPLTSESGSCVFVEEIGRARIGTRIAHPVLRTTLQSFLRAGAWVADRGDAPANLVFQVTRFSEGPARLLGAPRDLRREPVMFQNFEAEWLWTAPVPDPQVERRAA